MSKAKNSSRNAARTATKAAPGKKNQFAGTTATASKSTRSSTPVRVLVVAEPSYDNIAARAYQIWQRKGCPSGQDTENWILARNELTRAR